MNCWGVDCLREASRDYQVWNFREPRQCDPQSEVAPDSTRRICIPSTAKVKRKGSGTCSTPQGQETPCESGSVGRARLNSQKLRSLFRHKEREPYNQATALYDAASP
jgi:hypothetical protein